MSARGQFAQKAAIVRPVAQAAAARPSAPKAAIVKLAARAAVARTSVLQDRTTPQPVPGLSKSVPGSRAPQGITARQGQHRIYCRRRSVCPGSAVPRAPKLPKARTPAKRASRLTTATAIQRNASVSLRAQTTERATSTPERATKLCGNRSWKVVGILTGVASLAVIVFKVHLFISLRREGRLLPNYRGLKGLSVVFAFGTKGDHVRPPP